MKSLQALVSVGGAFDSPGSLNDAFSISSGTLLTKHTLYRNSYLPHGVIPACPWSSLMVRAEAINDAKRTTLLEATGNFICLADFALPADKLQWICEQVSRRHETTGDIADYLLTALAQKIECKGETTYLGVEYTKDSASTLTWDTDGRRTGLHVDSFFKCDLRERHNSPNRVCINLGPDDRYFMFMDTSVADMQDMLIERGDFPEDLRGHVPAITVHFAIAFPEHPVRAIRTTPGQGYVAPTECFVHDGFVPGRAINASASFFGEFRPKGPLWAIGDSRLDDR